MTGPSCSRGGSHRARTGPPELAAGAAGAHGRGPEPQPCGSAVLRHSVWARPGVPAGIERVSEALEDAMPALLRRHVAVRAAPSSDPAADVPGTLYIRVPVPAKLSQVGVDRRTVRVGAVRRDPCSDPTGIGVAGDVGTGQRDCRSRRDDGNTAGGKWGAVVNGVDLPAVDGSSADRRRGVASVDSRPGVRLDPVDVDLPGAQSRGVPLTLRPGATREDLPRREWVDAVIAYWEELSEVLMERWRRHRNGEPPKHARQAGQQE